MWWDRRPHGSSARRDRRAAAVAAPGDGARMRGRGAAPDPAHGGGDYVRQRRNCRGGRLRAALFLELLVTGAALAAVGAFLWVNCGLEGCPDVSTLRGYMPDEASQIVDRTGQPLAKLYLVRRTVVP